MVFITSKGRNVFPFMVSKISFFFFFKPSSQHITNDFRVGKRSLLGRRSLVPSPDQNVVYLGDCFLLSVRPKEFTINPKCKPHLRNTAYDGRLLFNSCVLRAPCKFLQERRALLLHLTLAIPMAGLGDLKSLHPPSPIRRPPNHLRISPVAEHAPSLGGTKQETGPCGCSPWRGNFFLSCFKGSLAGQK